MADTKLTVVNDGRERSDGGKAGGRGVEGADWGQQVVGLSSSTSSCFC
ncbi:MAG TPA: hypothetical protein VEP90_01715 [Methylomirabilota bacterium]|nr:hypothetical protein [Methylomirabilota bacterium]